jgi:hypothetical protein
MADSEEQMLAVECPNCGAEAGEPCGRRGDRRYYCHERDEATREPIKRCPEMLDDKYQCELYAGHAHDHRFGPWPCLDATPPVGGDE